MEFYILIGWLSIIFIIVYLTVIHYVRKNNEDDIEVVEQKLVEYDEEKIIKHLDYIIDESIDEYTLFNITPLGVDYITENIQNEMVDHLKSTIPDKLSNQLLFQLSYIYSNAYIGKFLGTHIYLKLTEFVVEYNMQKNI